MSLDQLLRIVRREAVATLQNSAIGRAGLRFYDAGSAVFEGGGGVDVRHSGYVKVDGDLTGSGDFDWTGSWSFAGPGTVTGSVAWSGDITLTGDMVVAATGRMFVGSMIIDPNSNGGSIKFSGGPEVYASGSKLSLYSGFGAFIELDGSSAKINGPGARWFEVTAAGFRAVGLPTRSGTGLPSGAVGADVDGTLWRAA
ncbi:hypothetical protein [Microbacterium sp. K41]|uniref:hypothetical protein n=1 Tax=Microbacterium sp. K41 TaxID=2305437 RepID=UPI00109D0D7C|nr:hypothetical protein [Microbacterium sp. K41]